MAKKDVKRGHIDPAGYFRVLVQYSEDVDVVQECVEMKFPRAYAHPSHKKDLEEAIASELDKIGKSRVEDSKKRMLRAPDGTLYDPGQLVEVYV